MKANMKRIRRLEFHGKRNNLAPIGLVLPPPISEAEWCEAARKQQADLKKMGAST